MSTEQLVALIGFVAVMTGTPGPNNLMLMASGANAGFRRSLPHILGIAIGCQVILVCVALGLGQLLTRFPQAVTALLVRTSESGRMRPLRASPYAGCARHRRRRPRPA